jgi:hypothetical protein
MPRSDIHRPIRFEESAGEAARLFSGVDQGAVVVET